MTFSFGNAQHIGARTSQQDAFGFSDPVDAAFVRHGGFCAVLCDGMGGMSNGDAASRLAVRTFLAAYQTKPEGESIPDALLRSLRIANTAVYEEAKAAGAAEDMGTTLVAAVLAGESLHWISAGDSAVFLYREGGLAMLNTPHIFARELDERVAAGSMTHGEAQLHPERESLTSYVGDPKLPLVDRSLRPFPLDADDCVLLASDGLFKTIDEAAIVRGMRGTFQERCDTLVKAVLERQRDQQDNVTVLALGRAEHVPVHDFIPPLPPPPRRSRKLRFALTALLMALAGGGALWLGLQRTPAPAARPPLPTEGAKPYDPSKRDPSGPRDEPAPPAEVRPGVSR